MIFKRRKNLRISKQNMLIHHVTPVLMVTEEDVLQSAESSKTVGTGTLARRLNVSRMRGWKMREKRFFGKRNNNKTTRDKVYKHLCRLYGEKEADRLMKEIDGDERIRDKQIKMQ